MADVSENVKGQGGLAETVLATLAVGTLQYGVAISLAAYIFSGPLAGGAGQAAVAFILATVITSLVVGLRSRMTTVIAGVQDTAAIVAAVIASSIAGSVSAEARLPTVLAMLAVAAVGSGIAMWLIGRFGYASVVRFLPYPVISGFMAGTGWLLLRGGLEVMLGRSVHLRDVPDLFAWSSLKFVILGIVLALFMTICATRKVPGAVVSAAVLVSVVAFHVVGRAVSSIDTIEEQGWLIGPFEQNAGWPPMRPADFAVIDWGALVGHSLGISVIAVVSIIGLMLNLSGLEGVLGEDIDVDHEMQVVGAANVVLGFGSGLVSYHLIGDTSLARQLGVRSRGVPFAIALLGIGVLLLGADLIAAMPRVVAGGVLSGLGLNLLVGWVTGPFRQMNRADRTVSGLILAVIASIGILTGVGAGLLLAVAIFVLRYSRIDPVRHAVRAAGRSNVDRSPEKRALLGAHADRIVAIELQGYLFFGSVRTLRATIDGQFARAGGAEVQGLRYLVFDFARVTGLDSTAAAALASSLRQLTQLNIVPVWSSLSPSIRAELIANGIDLADEYADLDHAIAWAEDRVIGEYEITPVEAIKSEGSCPANVRCRTVPRAVRAGDTLVTIDDDSRDLFFVDEGVLTAWSKHEDGRALRLRQVGSGSIVGEIAFCTGAPRTATVIADTDATVLVLTRQAFDEMAAAEPEVAVELMQYLLERLSERLTSTSGMVRELLR